MSKKKVEPLWVIAGHNDVFSHCEKELFDAIAQFILSLRDEQGGAKEKKKKNLTTDKTKEGKEEEEKDRPLDQLKEEEEEKEGKEEGEENNEGSSKKPQDASNGDRSISVD